VHNYTRKHTSTLTRVKSKMSTYSYARNSVSLALTPSFPPTPAPLCSRYLFPACSLPLSWQCFALPLALALALARCLSLSPSPASCSVPFFLFSLARAFSLTHTRAFAQCRCSIPPSTCYCSSCCLQSASGSCEGYSYQVFIQSARECVAACCSVLRCMGSCEGYSYEVFI